MSAPAMASTGMISTQNHQYSQPMVNPAQGPMASEAYVEKEPLLGLAMAISPSMRITSNTNRPVMA